MIDTFETRWGAHVIYGHVPYPRNGLWMVDILFKGLAVKWIAAGDSTRTYRVSLSEEAGSEPQITFVAAGADDMQSYCSFVKFVVAYENSRLDRQRGVDMKKDAILSKLFLNEGDGVMYYDHDFGPYDGGIREGRIVKAKPVPGKVAIRSGKNPIAYIPREHIIHKW